MSESHTGLTGLMRPLWTLCFRDLVDVCFLGTRTIMDTDSYTYSSIKKKKGFYFTSRKMGWERVLPWRSISTPEEEK